MQMYALFVAYVKRRDIRAFKIYLNAPHVCDGVTTSSHERRVRNPQLKQLVTFKR